MISREECLSAYGRYLELELLLPDWKQQLQEKTEALREAEENLRWRKHALKEMEDPNFFQRMLLNWEARTEKAREEYRTAAAEFEKRKWDTAQLETTFSEAQQEFDRLALDVQAYQQLLPLKAEEARYLAPAAVFAANKCHEALVAISPWASKEDRKKKFTPEYGYWNVMEEAEAYAETLMRLLTMLPEGTIAPGDYLKNPNGYIRGMATKDAQLIRLSKAMEQIRDLRRTWQEML